MTKLQIDWPGVALTLYVLAMFFIGLCVLSWAP